VAGLDILKSADSDEQVAVEKITYTFTATNTGNVTLTDVVIEDAEFNGAGNLTALECDQVAPVTLAPAEVLTCTATYVVQQADVDRGIIRNVATGTGTPPPGVDPPDPDPSVVTVPSDPDPSLALDKTASTDKVKAGDTIVYTFTVVNDGNVTISEAVVVETAFSGAGQLSAFDCDTSMPATLAPGESLVCTADYKVQKADAAAGSITNAAVAIGKEPNGGDVTSPVDEAVVEVQPLPLPVGKPGLPRTGAALLPLIAAALIASVGGAGMVFLSRKRRKDDMTA
jgi:hypothetical protein